MTDLKALRRTLRERRKRLPEAARRSADQKVHERIVGLGEFKRAKHIAAYLACGGEYDPMPVIEAAWRADKHVYLPVLVGRARPMLFAPYRPDCELRLNWLGIMEPVVAPERLCPPAKLDLVLTPLVGFDVAGNRLGMGGGYYDRSFGFLNGGVRGRPWLLGVGYELQKLAAVMRQSWDVRLDAVVTERALYRQTESAMGPGQCDTG